MTSQWLATTSIESVPKSWSSSNNRLLTGLLAVLGIDIVSFSTLEDEDQVFAVKEMYGWISQSLRGEDISEIHYRWSPAGDGGYITFNEDVSGQAIDIAFSILKKSKNSAWTPRDRTEIQLRFAVSLGKVQEGEEIGGRTNIWGLGINRTARMLTVSSPSQVLVAKEYYDLYIKPRRERDFKHGDFYTRTVKHGERIEIMNFAYNDLGLENDEANASRWYSVGYLQQKITEDYKLLIEDAMTSGNPLAAIAAARFLMDLKCKEPVEKLCHSIYEHGDSKDVNYPKVEHKIFSQIPNQVLLQIIEESEFRYFKKDELICKKGDNSKSTFFLVSGRIRVEGISGLDDFIGTPEQEIFGEFGLFASMKRTATLKAIDKCFLLEIDNKKFGDFLFEKSTLAEEKIRSIISGRIIDNLKKSETLFPYPKKNDNNSNTNDIIKKIDAVYDSATCEFICESNNKKLDLKKHVCVVFSGRVKIKPRIDLLPKFENNENQGNIYVDITGHGETGAGQIIGIFDRDKEIIDGDEATVLIEKGSDQNIKQQDGNQNTQKKQEERAEAIIILLKRHKINDLMLRDNDNYSYLAEHWDGLYGKRIGLIKRSQKTQEEQ